MHGLLRTVEYLSRLPRECRQHSFALVFAACHMAICPSWEAPGWEWQNPAIMSHAVALISAEHIGQLARTISGQPGDLVPWHLWSPSAGLRTRAQQMVDEMGIPSVVVQSFSIGTAFSSWFATAFTKPVLGGMASPLESFANGLTDPGIGLDFVDKANSYVLNNTYDGQRARSASTERLIVMSWIALLAFLALVQILVAWRFRRLINLGLALATVVALASGAFTLNRLGASSAHLADAREQAFQSVHVLARARATVVSARQSQGQFLLDPATADSDQVDFDDHVRRLLRMDGEDVVELAVDGSVPEGAAGYLARVAGPDATSSDPESAREVVLAFGGFLTEDAAMRRLVAENQTDAAMESYANGRAYTGLDAAITAAQANEQETFDEAADAAADAAAPLEELNFFASPGILLLALLGLFLRLREYRT